LSSVYLQTGQQQQSLYYSRKAIAHITTDSANGVIAIYNNTADCFYTLHQYDSAIYYSLKGLDLCARFPGNSDVRAQTMLYVTLAACKAVQNKYDEAIIYYNKALASEEIYPSLDGYVSIYSGLAEVYIKKNDYLQAEKYFKQALDASEKYGVGGQKLIGIHERLADLYHDNLRDDALAYHHKNTASKARDSLESADRAKMVAQLDISYRSAEKDRELSKKQLLLAQRESQLKQKNFWILFISVTIALAIVVIIIGYRNNKHKQRLHEAHIRTLEHEKEISTLQHTITGEEQERSRLARELHDGIMVLFSAIRMKLRQLPKSHTALQSDIEFNSLSDELEQAIKELRRTAHNLMPDMLLDGGLVEAVYYFSKSLQQNSPLQINFQQYGVLPRLKEDAELSLYRIVQELLQNVIRHSDANKALIQFNYRDEILCITVEDNGKGFDPRSIPKKGVGLRSIETRLKALNGSMDIRSTSSGTTVYLEFYLHTVIKTIPIEQVYH